MWAYIASRLNDALARGPLSQAIRQGHFKPRKDWRIINLILVSGLQEDGPG